MAQNLNTKFIRMKKSLYADGSAAVLRLIERKQDMQKAFNKKISLLLKKNGYLKKIVIPRKYIKLWQHRNEQVAITFNWKYMVSAPFIYGMFFPSVLFHISIELYQHICFRLYGIPVVQYREYFVYDRQLLSWLSPMEKINCIYCSYVNNLLRYSVEIGGRTERYWCPIKYYRRVEKHHSQYSKFLDGKKSSSAQIKKQWKELRDFSDLES